MCKSLQNFRLVYTLLNWEMEPNAGLSAGYNMTKQVHVCREQDNNLQNLCKTDHDLHCRDQSKKRHTKRLLRTAEMRTLRDISDFYLQGHIRCQDIKT